MKDLEQRKLHLIGKPEIRFREDPVRMLRALRLAGKLNFKLDSATENALCGMKALLHLVSPSRLFDELIKIFLSGKATEIFELMLQHEFVDELLPSLPKIWLKNSLAEALTKKALQNTDERISQNKSINPAFMLAVFFWPHVLKHHADLEKEGQKTTLAFEHAMNFAIKDLMDALNVPRRFTTTVREMWHLQKRFQGRASKRLLDLPSQKTFRAAYDFLLLRAIIDPDLLPLAQWWTQFYDAEHRPQREKLLKTFPKMNGFGKI